MGGVSVIRRYFALFDPAFNTRIDILEWSAGDFGISFDIYPGNSSLQGILSQSGSTNVFIRLTNITTAPVIAFKMGGVEKSISAPDIEQSKLKTVRVYKTGGTVSVDVDGVFQSSQTDAAWSGTFTADTIGALGSPTQFFDGYLANVRLDNGGSDNRLYKIDENLSSTTNVIDSISGENGTAVNFTSSDLFTKIEGGYVGDNKWTHGEVSSVSQANGLVGGVTVPVISGTTLMFDFEVFDFIEGKVKAYSGNSGSTIDSDGVYSDVVLASIPTAGFIVASNPTTLSIKNINVAVYLGES